MTSIQFFCALLNQPSQNTLECDRSMGGGGGGGWRDIKEFQPEI